MAFQCTPDHGSRGNLLWLLPFFSPLKDDGYDIFDYLDVHPMCGTVKDFRHAGDDRDYHESYVRSASLVPKNRQAPRDSPERNFYVWSDTGEKYKESCIILSDTERSDWAWDQSPGSITGTAFSRTSPT